jgi:hypothetical protein
MSTMRIKFILLILPFFIVWTACTSDSTVLPTLMPTVQLELPATPVFSLPATNTPISVEPIVDNVSELATSDAAEAEAVIEEIDREACEQALATQTELTTLQEQGQDVSELATAAAELVEELDNCEILLTPTPSN